MKFTTREATREAEGKKDDSKLSRFKAASERLMRPAVVAAFAVGFTVACGEDPGPADSGHGGDGGTVTDGGTTDGGGGDGGGPAELCTQYGPGDAHRALFNLGDSKSPGGTGTYFMRFRQIVGTGTGRVGGFLYYPADLSTSEGIGFNEGETKTKDIPGVGTVTFQLCEMTANPCTASTGDPACTATLASSHGW
ncbi:MAG: hypothetical protein AB1529_00820 [Candidatus Micrarchaeota archaeon]